LSEGKTQGETISGKHAGITRMDRQMNDSNIIPLDQSKALDSFNGATTVTNCNDTERTSNEPTAAVIQITNNGEVQSLIRPVITRVTGSPSGPLILTLDMGDVQVTVTYEGLTGCKLIAYPFIDTYDDEYQGFW
jgi:hypothetical protein